MGDWSQPGPGLRRVTFGCGHTKFLPKETIYRESHHHGSKWKKRCRECRQQLQAEQEQQRQVKAARVATEREALEQRLRASVRLWRMRKGVAEP